ncbi:MAG: hypothetical protein GX181_00160 [Synergistaceae bacterium]|nr:hypothetical protein [Synergistaceae bacterium]
MRRDLVGSLLSYLGLARRSGVLIIGQDNVKSSLARREKLLLLFSDTNSAFFRSIRSRLDEEGVVVVAPGNITGEELSSAIGAKNVKVVALPLRSGFAKKILQLLAEGGKDIE